jgi:hypothetical protein
VGNFTLLNAPGLQTSFPERFWAPPAGGLDDLLVPGVWAKLRVIEIPVDGIVDVWDSRSVWVEIMAREDTVVRGRVTIGLDWPGFHDGDVLVFQPNRVFDICTFDENAMPIPHAGKAEFMIGKSLVVGITVLSHDGGLVEHRQSHGQIRQVRRDGVIIELARDGESQTLPPDLRGFDEAAPGEYRLRSTGEVVRDPDFECTWTMRRARPKGSP